MIYDNILTSSWWIFLQVQDLEIQIKFSKNWSKDSRFQLGLKPFKNKEQRFSLLQSLPFQIIPK